MALSLFTDETYFLNEVQGRWLPAQYVCAIMQYGIGRNIVNIANQLSFAYWGQALELWVFVLPLTKSTKVADLICMLKEKQEV